MAEPLMPYNDFVAFAAGDNVDQTRFDGVIAAIRRYCGWHIAPLVEETFTVDGPGGTELMLPTLQLVAVESVVDNGQTLTDGTDFDWSEDGSLERRHGHWGRRKRGVVVRAQHGHDSAPADVVSVVLDAVSRAVSVPAGQQPEKMGPFEFGGSRGGVDFFESEKRTLDLYRLESRP